MKGLFFTGTDTGAGKTFVTAAVACALRARGKAVRLSKPVATGARWTGSRWRSDDTLELARAAGVQGEEELDAITPWTFPVPAAPPVAARLAGSSLSLGQLAEAVRRQERAGSLLLVEGVGGLLCPLTEQETVADLVRSLGLPLVVVARRSLGTLNHTLLTVEVARGRGLAIAGVVISETAPLKGPAEESNVEELRRRLDVPILAVVPHQASPELACPAVEAVDWERLSAG